MREITRDQVECKIVLKPETAERLKRDAAIKAMVYCTAEPISPFTKADIAFPHQVEIKVNGNEPKANLRGLKNKPGSTRPADITHLLHRRPPYESTLTITYALTQRVRSLSGNSGFKFQRFSALGRHNQQVGAYKNLANLCHRNFSS